jgi:hypothetical protein
MTPKFDKALETCITTGVDRGYSRAHKHIDNPTEQQIKHAIESAIWDEIYEWFDNVHREIV